MNLFNLNVCKLLAAIIGLSLCSSSIALPSDRHQTIEIEADFAERNEKTGTMIYRGNVVISQGTILIEADQVDVLSNGNKVTLITCSGKPASYQQQPDEKPGLVIAKAESIEYQLAADKIVLKRNASLSRNGTLIKGDTINYDLKEQSWKARGNNQGKQKRIQLVIPPSKQEEKALSEGGKESTPNGTAERQQENTPNGSIRSE